jgi:hypothetical protein
MGQLFKILKNSLNLILRWPKHVIRAFKLNYLLFFFFSDHDKFAQFKSSTFMATVDHSTGVVELFGPVFGLPITPHASSKPSAPRLHYLLLHCQSIAFQS